MGFYATGGSLPALASAFPLKLALRVSWALRDLFPVPQLLLFCALVLGMPLGCDV